MSIFPSGGFCAVQMLKNIEVRKAISMGAVCALSYLACYFARNLLSAVTPYMLEGGFDVSFIGLMSTACMLSYALGQLINGFVGVHVPAKYMVSGGLCFSGVCNLLLHLSAQESVMLPAYALSGFFLSMIYAPIVKLVAENTLPRYASRCCLGFTFASLFGTPMAGLAAVVFQWRTAFLVCSIALLVMGCGCCMFLSMLEHKGYIARRRLKRGEKAPRLNVRSLLEHDFIRFCFISVLTGCVRTSVMFWVPTYLAQNLGFTADDAAQLFMVITLVCSMAPWLNNLVIYDILLRRNMYLMLKLSFGASTLAFLLMLLAGMPWLNVILLTLALVTCGGASSMLYSVYCPSLKATGSVSSATGFIDFLSYAAAAFANLVFANAIEAIGWSNLIIVWAGIMFAGFLIVLPCRKQ